MKFQKTSTYLNIDALGDGLLAHEGRRTHRDVHFALLYGQHWEMHLLGLARLHLVEDIKTNI